nr:MAG TPA: hypothetical protein [Caudoviricetes sp.]
MSRLLRCLCLKGTTSENDRGWRNCKRLEVLLCE